METDLLAEEDQDELLSFYDWVILIRSCFDPMQVSAKEPAGHSFFRDRHQQRHAGMPQASGQGPAAGGQQEQALAGLSQAMQ